MSLQKSASVLPSAHDVGLASSSSRDLAAYIQSTEVPMIGLVDQQGHAKTLQVPHAALQLFVEVLTEISKGHAVTLAPLHAELTTQQAADLLQVSRPYLVKLLDEGCMPYRKVGTKRRVLADDVLAYKAATHQRRQQVLDALAQKSQDLDLGYE